MDNNTEQSEQTILQRMADLIAYSEITLQKPEQPIKNFLADPSKDLDKLFNDITTDIYSLREIMTRSGAQKLRETTEKLSLESKKEIKLLENISKKTNAAIALQCNQLNKAAMGTVKNISQLISAVRQHQLKKITETKLAELNNTCEKNTQKIQHLFAILQRKIIITSICITLLVATIINLYIDDAWPWQAHRQFLNQREAGKVLLNTWPQLSSNDRELIVQNA